MTRGSFEHDGRDTDQPVIFVEGRNAAWCKRASRVARVQETTR